MSVVTITRDLPHPKPAEPNAELVAALRNLLADAEDGTLRSFVGCGIEADEATVHSVWVGELTRSRFTLYGGILRLQHAVRRRMFPDDEADGL